MAYQSCPEYFFFPPPPSIWFLLFCATYFFEKRFRHIFAHKRRLQVTILWVPSIFFLFLNKYWHMLTICRHSCRVCSNQVFVCSMKFITASFPMELMRYLSPRVVQEHLLHKWNTVSCVTEIRLPPLQYLIADAQVICTSLIFVEYFSFPPKS